MKKRPQAASARTSRKESSWPDTRLVRECLRGNEDAWAALIDKYKNLVFSIPVKRGLAHEDAADVFQRVCLLLLAELGSLREPRALREWLISVTSRECSESSRQDRAHARPEPIEEQPIGSGSEPSPEELRAQVGEEQSLREALQGLSPPCRQTIQMLFFEPETRPYQAVAGSPGLATDSIGLIRAKCLEQLRRRLASRDFPGR